MHGSDQLQEHAKSARLLSEAKQNLFEVQNSMWMYTGGSQEFMSADEGERRLDEAQDLLIAAEARCKAAYLAYTNPFGVEKTV